ncbi:MULTISPECIES: hypothetical protein, partial [unclassified Mucilaginibacter]|uniref:hypothetical protein n=1 Tax=unclassified Mucilaginibacter TaxID=2617802 RepID=UPI002B231FA2
MPLLSLTGILKDGLLKYPANAFSLRCKSIRLINLPEDAIKSIIQDCTQFVSSWFYLSFLSSNTGIGLHRYFISP